MTKIEYAAESWNPVTGCTHAGTPGCDHCWAKRMAHRLAGRCGYPRAEPFMPGVLHPKRLDQLAKWKSRVVFVCPMGDLWHEAADDVRPRVIHAARRAPQHVYLFLTKRPERVTEDFTRDKNFWIGATIETTSHAACQRRIPDLARVRAAHKWISAEPLLGPLTHWAHCGAEWIVIGCENQAGRVGRLGLGADGNNELLWWVRACGIAADAQAHGVASFLKQVPVAGRVSHDPDEWSDATVRRREYPPAITNHLTARPQTLAR